MKKSPNTDEVSLRSAKESIRGGKIVQPRENDTKLIPCGSWKGLDNGQPWQEYSENAAENHLETVNIESNGKSRITQGLGPMRSFPLVTERAPSCGTEGHDGDEVG